MAVLPVAPPSVLRDPRAWRPGRDRSHWTLTAFVVAHVLAVVAGRATRLEELQLALVWPAAAVAVLWMLHARASRQLVRHGVALALTTAAGNLLTGASPALAVAFGAAAVLQGCVTVSLLPAGFRLRTVAALGRLVLAGTAGSLASAGLGSVELRLLADVDLRATFGLWAVRNTASVLVLVPIALRLWDDGPTVRATSAGRGETAVVLGVLGLGHALLLLAPSAPAGVLLLPVSIWVALRWSTAAASLHALSTATVAVVLTALDRGPFAGHPPALGMVLTLLFVLTVALVVLSTALTSDERADLVHRLRHEQQQSAAQALMLETVLDTVDVAIVASDAAGRPVLVNRTARALHDLDDDDGCLPDAVPVGRVLAQGRLSDPLLVVEVPGRAPRTVRSEGRALHGPDGTLLGAVVVQTDVTALCASEQQFRAAFEDGPTPTARLDGAGRVEQTNAALRRLLSLPSKRLLGRELVDLAIEEDREVLRAAGDDPPGAGPVEVRLRRADGGPLWCEVSRTLVRSPGAAPYVLAQVLDVHARKSHELALEDVAHRDALTGLDNRHALDRRLGDLLVGSGAAHVVLAYLDLDGFKGVNDVHGHDAGDAVLRAVGERLLRLVRADDVAARLGGDEFVVACGVPDGQVAEHFAAVLAARIEQALGEPVAHGDVRLELGVSVGTAVAPSSGDPTEVLHRADLAMYERKRARKGPQTPLRWVQAPLRDDEAARLTALRGLQVLDTPPEQVLDELCEAAALVAGVPTALVSLVDEQRQWFKARCGLDAPETGRDVSFCSYVVALDDELHVEDARRDDRFADNPLVAGDLAIRSYAGFPLRTPQGHVLGSLCVIGYVPALLLESQRRVLRVLADQATSLLLARDGHAQPRTSQVPAQRSSRDGAVEACAC